MSLYRNQRRRRARKPAQQILFRPGPARGGSGTGDRDGGPDLPGPGIVRESVQPSVRLGIDNSRRTQNTGISLREACQVVTQSASPGIPINRGTRRGAGVQHAGVDCRSGAAVDIH
jgi:hypothetical protein